VRSADFNARIAGFVRARIGKSARHDRAVAAAIVVMARGFRPLLHSNSSPGRQRRIRLRRRVLSSRVNLCLSCVEALWRAAF